MTLLERSLFNICLHGISFQANHELGSPATIDSPRVLTFPYRETDQSPSHNVSSPRSWIRQSVNESSHDLHVRRTTTHDDLVLQEVRDKLVERVTRSPKEPAALQVPIIPRHFEHTRHLTATIYSRELSLFLVLEGFLPTLHALVHKRGALAHSNVQSSSRHLSIHS